MHPWTWQADPAEQAMGFSISNQSPFLIQIGQRAPGYGFNIGATFGANVPATSAGTSRSASRACRRFTRARLSHERRHARHDLAARPRARRALFAYFVSEAAKAPRSAIDPQ